MYCDMCGKPIVDNNFRVGFPPGAEDTSNMIVGHSECVNRVIEAIENFMIHGFREEES